VILLKTLNEGALLVTGPFKINGVPIRRVNSRYVIATQTKVDIKGVDSKLLEKLSGDKYFAREKSEKKKGEEAFFKQGEKPEVRCATTMLSSMGHINSVYRRKKSEARVWRIKRTWTKV
jgi:large subunit ribosomal protein L6e